jgi:hypothetical protein
MLPFTVLCYQLISGAKGMRDELLATTEQIRNNLADQMYGSMSWTLWYVLLEKIRDKNYFQVDIKDIIF